MKAPPHSISAVLTFMKILALKSPNVFTGEEKLVEGLLFGLLILLPEPKIKLHQNSIVDTISVLLTGNSMFY